MKTVEPAGRKITTGQAVSVRRRGEACPPAMIGGMISPVASCWPERRAGEVCAQGGGAGHSSGVPSSNSPSQGAWAGSQDPEKLMRHLLFLNPDYTVARYPEAANGVPYDLYDKETAANEVKAAEELSQWVESLTRS